MNEVELTKIFKSFGNQNRIKILRLLKKDKESPVAEIARKIKLSVKSTSKHLNILLNVGILENEGKNKSVFYKINHDVSEFVTAILKILP